MADIRTFPYKKEEFHQLREYHFGLNWPVVYIQENGKEMYIGQTTNLYSRSKQHYEKPERAKLKWIHVLTDEEFNLSATHDFESLLIQYIAAEGKYILQNGNGGLINHNYFEREKYQGKLETLWAELKKVGLVHQDINHIRNSEFFKYSPYKALTPDQLIVAEELKRNVRKRTITSHIVNGGPGTGKSILALYLLKHLKDTLKDRELKMALVVPMAGLRKTLQRVVQRVPGLGTSMVIGPSDVVKEKYDLLIVDEAHRLRQRKNLANYGSYDALNRKMGFPKDATQLDWIMASSKQQILFYDERQNVVPADIGHAAFTGLNAKHYELTSQMRVEGGENYIQFVDRLLDGERVTIPRNTDYDFRLFDNITDFLTEIRKREVEYTLARVVAGYAWSWKTKGGKPGHDIEIENAKLVWNSTNINWVNSSNAINEVGCIHTIQGYDLNYAGVIIGPELSYDSQTNKIIVDEKKYKDINGKRSLSHPDELKRFIINIYKTLLTRGIKGTYVYVCDKKLRAHFDSLLGVAKPMPKLTPSPITVAMVRIPLVGSAPCGNPLLGEENIEEYISVSKDKIKSGFQYFILRAEGNSMDLAGIQDGDLVLCRQQQKAETGDRVVALIGGENVTIKEYGPRENGIRLLMPKSTNRSYQPIVPMEGDLVQGVVQEVLDAE